MNKSVKQSPPEKTSAQKITSDAPDASHFDFPPPIARLLGVEVITVGDGMATLELSTDPARHGNPMGTLHGGVIADIADMAIGSAHMSTLAAGESFTSIDLQLNFFRPVWKDRIRAVAKPIHVGKSVSRYLCDVTRADGKLVAQVLSTVMTLRGDAARGR